MFLSAVLSLFGLGFLCWLLFSLVAGAGEDTIWPSAFMAGNIAERRAEAGALTIAIISESAGHGLCGPGFAPTTEYGSGGDPAANGRTQVEAWRASLDMFERQLSTSRDD